MACFHRAQIVAHILSPSKKNDQYSTYEMAHRWAYFALSPPMTKATGQCPGALLFGKVRCSLALRLNFGLGSVLLQ